MNNFKDDTRKQSSEMLLMQIDEHIRRIKSQAEKLEKKADVEELKRYVHHLVKLSEV